jgi:hypothetical protein
MAMLTPEPLNGNHSRSVELGARCASRANMRAFRGRIVPLVLAVVAAACLETRQPPSEPTDARRESARSAPLERHLAFAILEDYDKGDDLAEIRRDFAMFRDLGITTWRGSLGWDDFEPQRGEYDFDWLHRFADAAQQDGITLRPYVGYTPAWAAAGGADDDVWNDPPANLDDWGAFVRELTTALHRHPNVRSLEIYNEENVPQWWDGSAAQYRAVLERAAREIRRVDRRFQVLLGGMVYPDTDWLDEVCDDDGGRLFDLLPFHAYPETWTPPDVDLERYLGPDFDADFVRHADESCGTRPIWINETGFATTDGIEETAQAVWWARAIATFAAEPRIEGIGVYEIKDLAPDRDAIGGAPNYHLGITRADRSKKPAFDTVRMLASAFSRGPYVVQPPAVTASAGSGELFAHGFRLADGRQLLIAWAKRAPLTVDLAPASKGARASERRLDGGSVPFSAFDGTVLHGVSLTPGAVRIFEIDK